MTSSGESTPDTPRAQGIVKYVPNALTLFRLLCLPVFFWLYGLQAPGFAWYAALLMWVAAWSDVADGYIARHYNATSEFGRLVDPLADRAFFVTVFVAYIYYGTMPWWSAAPVLARDAVMLLASVVFFGTTKERPRVLKLGKWANFVLAWSVGFFMIGLPMIAWPIYIVGATLYVVSGALYFVRYARERRRAASAESGTPLSAGSHAPSVPTASSPSAGPPDVPPAGGTPPDASSPAASRNGD